MPECTQIIGHHGGFQVGAGKNGSQLYRRDNIWGRHQKTYIFSSPAIAEIAIAGDEDCNHYVKLTIEKTFTLDSVEKVASAVLYLNGQFDPKIFEYQ